MPEESTESVPEKTFKSQAESKPPVKTPSTPESITREQPIQVVVGDVGVIAGEIGRQLDWFSKHPEYTPHKGYAPFYQLSETWFYADHDAANDEPDTDGENTAIKFVKAGGQEGSLKYRIESEVSVPAEAGTFADGRLHTKAYTPERVAKIVELLSVQGVVSKVNELEDSSHELVMDAGENALVVNLGGSDVGKYDRALREQVFELEDSTDESSKRIKKIIERTRSDLKGKTADEVFYQSEVHLVMIPKKDWEEIKAAVGSFKGKGFDYGDKKALADNLGVYAKTYGAFMKAFYGEKGILLPQTTVKLSGNEFQPPKYPAGTMI